MSEQNYKEIFQEAMNQLHQHYISIGKESDFILWFKIEYVEDTISEITVSVPSDFMGKSIESRGNFKILQNKINEITGMNISIKYIVQPKNVCEQNNQEDLKPKSNSFEKENSENFQKKETPTLKKHPQLSENYTFDSFIPGDNCYYAYNASLAVAKNPGKSFNPVLIYGGVGLGKTHLMHSIGNYIYEHNNNLKIICITAENFTNEFTSSLQKKDPESFKKKYRNCDVLLIDDIHFFQGKDGTQEELFHTFNALYESKKQIVWTCDRPISELKQITERLASRFERGISVDLKAPNFETKIAIINKKLELLNKQMPEEVKEYLAKNCQTNVRDLEGLITKVLGYSELCDKPITLEITQDILKDNFSLNQTGLINVETIQKVVANHFNISFSDIKGKKQNKKIALPRHIAIYISRQLTEYSFPELGNEFGGRDHTTIMHSYEKIENQIKIDSSLNSTIQLLMREIKNYKK